MTGDRRITKGHGRLLVAGAAAVFLLVTMGGTVCITGSTLGCPDWPGCYGRVVPPLRAASIIEYSHRVLALFAAPLVVAAAGIGWWRVRRIRWVARPPMLAIVAFLAVSVFGAFAVLMGLPPYLAAVDLGLALVALALMVTAAAVAGARRRTPSLPDRLSLSSSFGRLVGGTLGATFGVLVLGVLVAEPESIARCLGWPLYHGGEALAATSRGPLQSFRVLLSIAAGIGVLALPFAARSSERPGVTGPATAGVVLLVAEVGLGGWLTTRGATPMLLVAYVTLACGLFTALTLLTVRAALPRTEVEPAGLRSAARAGSPVTA